MSQTSSSPEVQRPAAAVHTRWRGEYGPPRMPAPGHAADAGELEPGACGRRSAHLNGTTCGRHQLAPVTVDRLVRCYHLCMRLRRDGRQSVSSRELGELLGCRSSLIRKDLSRLGNLGTRGYGYRVAGLFHALEGRLGGVGPVTAVLVGAGALGAGLLARGGFSHDDLSFLAAFDFDPSRDGTRCDGLLVHHVSRMSDVLGRSRVDVGVLAVSETEAQEAAQLLAENGVRAILNLTPAILSSREGTVVANIDLGTELKKLAFLATDSSRRRRGDDAASADGRDIAVTVGGTRQ